MEHFVLYRDVNGIMYAQQVADALAARKKAEQLYKVDGYTYVKAVSTATTLAIWSDDNHARLEQNTAASG